MTLEVGERPVGIVYANFKGEAIAVSQADLDGRAELVSYPNPVLARVTPQAHTQSDGQRIKSNKRVISVSALRSAYMIAYRIVCRLVRWDSHAVVTPSRM